MHILITESVIIIVIMIIEYTDKHRCIVCTPPSIEFANAFIISVNVGTIDGLKFQYSDRRSRKNSI